MASGNVDVAVRVNSACGKSPMGKPVGRLDFRACNDSVCADNPVRYSFKRHETIGTGGSGSVCSGSLICGEASDSLASIEVAIKAVRRVGLGKRAQMYLAREIAVHKALSHPNICKFISQTYDKDFVYIVMEILKGGDLYSVLKRQRSGFDEKASLTIISQVLCALKQMHVKGISHRDIKLENIVFSHEPDFSAPESLMVKLIDFGLACVRNPKAAPEDRMSSEKCGTVRYAAPEVVLEPSYLPEQVDIWGAGIVLYSMIARCNPYNGKTDKDVLHNIEHSELHFRGPAWEHVSEGTKKLIRKMLSKRPSDRPSATAALEEVEAILKRLSDEGVLCTAKSWLSNISDFLTPNGSRSNDITEIGSSVTSLKGPGLSKKSDDEDGKSSSESEEGQARPVVDSWMTIVRNMVTMVGER